MIEGTDFLYTCRELLLSMSDDYIDVNVEYNFEDFIFNLNSIKIIN